MVTEQTWLRSALFEGLSFDLPTSRRFISANCCWHSCFSLCFTTSNGWPRKSQLEIKPANEVLNNMTFAYICTCELFSMAEYETAWNGRAPLAQAPFSVSRRGCRTWPSQQHCTKHACWLLHDTSTPCKNKKHVYDRILKHLSSRL